MTQLGSDGVMVDTFDLGELLPRQRVIVKTYGNVTLSVVLPKDSKTVIEDGGRRCMSQLWVSTHLLDANTSYKLGSQVIKVGESWQYDQYFHSHQVVSIAIQTIKDPLLCAIMDLP